LLGAAFWMPAAVSHWLEPLNWYRLMEAGGTSPAAGSSSLRVMQVVLVA
jgi:hypothetical protein